MKTLKLANKRHQTAGTSLIEILLVVGVITTIATLAYTIISSVMPNSSQSKLHRQVAVLNASATMYRINGGHIDPLATTTEVFKKLQVAALEEETDQLVGFAGSMVDPDLQAIPTSEKETDDTSVPRVVWNAEHHKFMVSHKPQEGIKSFHLDSTGAADRIVGRESRLPGGAIKYSKDADWVWDFDDTAITTTGPDYIPGHGGTYGGPGTPPPPSTGPVNDVLAPPLISTVEGTYPITSYQLQVTLANPNPADAGEIYYSINRSPLRRYKGEILEFEPEQFIAAITKPLSKEWKRSIYSVAYYSASPVQLKTPIVHASAPQFDHDINDTIHVTLDNPNNPNVSDIEYTLNGGTWQTYKNKSIRIDNITFPTGVTISTRAVPTAEYYLTSNIRSRKVGPAVATVLSPPLITFSEPDFTKDIDKIKVTLNNPNLPGSSDLYYAITDPEKFRDESKKLKFKSYSKAFDVKSRDYKNGFAIIAYARASSPAFQDSIKAERETGAIDETAPPTPPVDLANNGLAGGHFDIDTSSFISKFHTGSTDAHVHAYDDKYDTTGADFFALHGGKLHNITDDIPADNKFKIIVANPDLSPGGRLVINRNYNADDPSTWIPVQEYANIPVEDLPTFSLNGAPDSTQLVSFGIYFDKDDILNNNLIPTNTGDVRDNIPGKNGEWRNGALTIQAVKMKKNKTNEPDFATSIFVSNGGKHGGATKGLLWEATLFSHWDGDSYHEATNTYAATEYIPPTGTTDTTPTITRFFTGQANGEFHSPTGDPIPVTNLDSNDISNYFEWDGSNGSSSEKNSLFFTGRSFQNVAVGEQFALGTMEFYNSATGNSDETVHVAFDVNLNLEVPSLTENLGFSFDIFSTQDVSSQTDDQNADYFTFGNFASDFSAELDGRLYGLTLQFGDIVSNGFSTGGHLYAHEGTTASGIIYGSFYMVDPADLADQLMP